MDYEYQIEVMMTPHYWDNKNAPYFWMIREGNCNSGCGWSETPEKAFADALDYYNKYKKVRS